MKGGNKYVVIKSMAIKKWVQLFLKHTCDLSVGNRKEDVGKVVRDPSSKIKSD